MYGGFLKSKGARSMVCFLMREFASLCGVSTGLMFCHFSGRAARQLCAAAPRTTLCLGAAFHCTDGVEYSRRGRRGDVGMLVRGHPVGLVAVVERVHRPVSDYPPSGFEKKISCAEFQSRKLDLIEN